MNPQSEEGLVMTILVRCPNGHVLHIKEKHAGKSGLCPHCHARIDVPASRTPPPHGTARPPLAGKKETRDRPAQARQEPWHASENEQAGAKLTGSAMVRHKKPCPNCAKLIPYWYATCPYCKSPMSTLAKL